MVWCLVSELHIKNLLYTCNQLSEYYPIMHLIKSKIHHVSQHSQSQCEIKRVVHSGYISYISCIFHSILITLSNSDLYDFSDSSICLLRPQFHFKYLIHSQFTVSYHGFDFQLCISIFPPDSLFIVLITSNMLHFQLVYFILKGSLHLLNET